MVGGEVLESGGGEVVEGVTGFDLVGDVGIGDVGVAGAGDWDEEGLVWGERGGRGGDVAGFGDGEPAEVEEVSNGGEVEEVWRGGSEEDVGLAGEDGLVWGAGVACGGGLGMGLMEEEKKKVEEEEKWVREEEEMVSFHVVRSVYLSC